MLSSIDKELEKITRKDRELTKIVVDKIQRAWTKFVSETGMDKIKIMNFCGTHEYTITHYGLRALLPQGIELVAGPGCPVCVTPSYYIEELIKLSMNEIVVYTYGDAYRLRSHRGVDGIHSLADARSRGGFVKVVPDLLTAIKDAKTHDKPSVFVGIGFETVAPGYSQAILRGHLPRNLTLLSLVKSTPPAMFYSLEVAREKPTESPIMGIIAPGHVSTIVGAKAWVPVAENYNIPVVVSGFEPLDVLVSILEILNNLFEKRSKVVIEYVRAVSFHGDLHAQSMITKVFEMVDDSWRGIGFIPNSGLRIREYYGEYDASIQYGIKDLDPSTWRYDMPPGCKCAEIVLGKAYPSQCPLFMKACTPSRPIGPCMVSQEGTCSIWAKYGSRESIQKISRVLRGGS